MSWAVGYDTTWHRDVGYGVPAVCDQPDCTAEIDRGLAYVCGGEPLGGDTGCGLYFCVDHLVFGVEETGGWQVCERCLSDEAPFDAKPDTAEWVTHKLTDKSWAQWRSENVDEVTAMRVSP